MIMMVMKIRMLSFEEKCIESVHIRSVKKKKNALQKIKFDEVENNQVSRDSRNK